jgi:hypothetical protein
LAVPGLLLYGSVSLPETKQQLQQTESSEVRILRSLAGYIGVLRSVAGYIGVNKKRNADILDNN